MIVSGNYNEIKKQTLSFISEQFENHDVNIHVIMISVNVFLSFTELDTTDQTKLYYEVAKVVENKLAIKRINIEKNNASKEVLSDISPY